MTVQCASCAEFTLQNLDGRSGKEMAAHGFGTCKRKPGPGRYESARFERQCHMFVAVPIDVKIKRAQWLDRKRQEFLDTIRAAQAREKL